MVRSGMGNISPLSAHIGFWMRMVSNAVSFAFAKKLEASGVTVAEWVVLREMYAGDETMNPGDVARITGLTRGAISKLVSRLLAKNLVTRREAKDDRRYQDIRLTAVGVEILPRLAAIADENDTQFFSCLDEEEKARLLEILKKLALYHEMKAAPVE